MTEPVCLVCNDVSKLAQISTEGGEKTPLFLLATRGCGPQPPHASWAPAIVCRRQQAERLVAHGACVNTAGDNSGTPLHGAAISPPNSAANESVTMLVNAGADLSARDWRGRSPLHWLVILVPNHCATAKLLLIEGCDVNSRDNNGLTPLDVLCLFSPHRQDTISLFETFGARRNALSRPFEACTSCGDEAGAYT